MFGQVSPPPGHVNVIPVPDPVMVNPVGVSRCTDWEDAMLGLLLSPWICESEFWQPTLVGVSPFPHSLTSDFTWFIAYTYAFSVGAIDTVAATSNIAAIVAIVNLWLYALSLAILL